MERNRMAEPELGRRPLPHADRDHPPHVQLADLGGARGPVSFHAELAELDRLAAQAVADHDVARSEARRTIRPFL